MNTPLYKICELGQGKLFMMPKPTAHNLVTDIAYYQSQGIDIVLSLLRAPEIEALGLMDEPNVCKAHQIEFMHFPVKDMDVPDLQALQTLNSELKTAMELGKSIAVHCHGGRGRAGTVAVTLMQEFGYTSEEAMKVAQAGRQDPNVPVCEIQVKFVTDYSPSNNA